jgi:hypothetical protein
MDKNESVYYHSPYSIEDRAMQIIVLCYCLRYGNLANFTALYFLYNEAVIQ